jgi:F0F1-type ATP synthase epsilon subunit
MGTLRLEVITPRGLRVKEGGLTRVVLRRREAHHDPGSQIVVLPSHAPLLVQTPAFDLCYSRGLDSYVMAVGPGIAEVLDDTVTLVASESGAVESAGVGNKEVK